MPDKVWRAYETAIDPATGLYDEQTIRLRIVEELSRAQRYRYPVSLIVVTFPHPKAKHTEDHIRQLAEVLERHVRTADILARCGRNSLVLLLLHTDEAGARRLGERIDQLATVMQLPAGLGGNPAPVHIGVTTVPADCQEDAAQVVEALWKKLCHGVEGATAHVHFIPPS